MEAQKRFVRTSVHIDELRSKQEKRRHRRAVMYVLLLLGATLVFLAVCFFVFFRIGEIRLEGNEIYTDEQILEQVDVALGDNLFSFRASQLQAHLRRELPLLGEVTVRRQLPSTLVIEIHENREELALEVGEEMYLLSGDLQVLSRIGKNEVIHGMTLLKTGMVKRCIVGECVQFVNTRTADNLQELYRCLSAYQLMDQVVSIDMSSRFDIRINYADRFSVYLGDIGSMDVKIRFLVGVLEQLRESDRGKIYLSDTREAAVQLENTSQS